MNSTLLNGSPNGKSKRVRDEIAWHDRADELADWALERLVNRDDRHGRYYTKGDKVRQCAAPADEKDVKVGYLTRERLIRHFRATDTNDIVGLYAYGADKRGKWVAIDIDNHDDKVDSETNRAYALHLYAKATRLGITSLLYESNGRGGFHLWLLFSAPVPARVLHRLGNWLVADHAEHGFAKPPEVFPKNEGATKWGHWLRLPGRHHTRDVWSTVWTGTGWMSGERAVEHILSLTGSDPKFIPDEAEEFSARKTKADPKGRKKADRPAGAPEEPWEAFNRAATIESVAAMLERHGWARELARPDGAIPFVRPGKSDGQGANLKLENGIPVLYVFTTQGDIPEGAHAPAAVRCRLEFNGDFKALNARLRAEGYGSAPEPNRPGYPSVGAPVDPAQLTEGGYIVRGGSTFHCALKRDAGTGEWQVDKQTRLANFAARIVSETVNDDGAETTRELVLSVEQTNKPTVTVTVPAEHFGAMDWTVERCGPRCVIQAGGGKRDHLRCAVQELSGADIPSKTIYRHTGWREIDGAWCYLHGNGAIVPVVTEIPVSAGVEVRLDGAAVGFRLPPPPEGDQLRAAVRASLDILNGLAPDAVAFPLLATVYRAALGGADYALWLSGRTGVHKSELAALAQQHYGASMTRNRLPGNWSSTDNAIEGLAFTVKDALLVIDDFAPSANRADADRQQKSAERVIRAQGNCSGRQRMRADGSLRPPKPPRGLILGTGEDVPRGQSIAARLVVQKSVTPRGVEHIVNVPVKVKYGCAELSDAARR